MSYTRLTGTRLKFFDANGVFAVGYKLWQVAAGTTDTAITTYGAPASDGSIGSANPNPIVLPANGECDVLTLAAVKLCFCLPTSTGPTDGVIETVDWLGMQQGVPPLLATITPVTTHNNYVATISPIATSLQENQMIILTPDVDNKPTLVTPPGASSPTVFTGTGINDCFFSGPYVGTTPGAVFQVEVIAAVVQPPTAPTLAAGAAGLVNNGAHQVLITFVTPEGETIAGSPSDPITISANDKIEVSAIPLGPAGQNVTDRNVYMTKAGGSTYYLVGSVGDNTTTTYEINLADASLPATEPPSTNGTGDGSGADLVQWRVDGGSWTPASITETDQTTIDGITFKFSVKTGHTVGDIWTVTVETPVRLDFCHLNEQDNPNGWLVEKTILVPNAYNVIEGKTVSLDGGEWKAGYPAVVLASPSTKRYLIPGYANPQPGSQIPKRIRKEIYGDETIKAGEQGMELHVNNSCTLTFDPLANLANLFFYVKIKAGISVVIQTDSGHPTNLIYPPYSAVGVTSITMPDVGADSLQFQCNGDDLHVLAQTTPPRGSTGYYTPGTYSWTVPWGVDTIYLTGCATGGAGAGAYHAGANGDAGAGGENGQFTYMQPVTVVPGSTITITIPGPATGGVAANPGATGGNASFGSLVTLTGGAGGSAHGGTVFTLASETGGKGTDGKGGMFGQGGEGGLALGALTNPGATEVNGQDGTGYGSGGGGAGVAAPSAAAATADGGDSTGGFLEWSW